MVSLLESIKQLFKRLLSTSASQIPHSLSGMIKADRIISKIDMGKSFNGHGMVLSTCKFGDATIIRYYNKY